MSKSALPRLRRGLAAVAIGKPLSALAGLLTLILLSGWLPTAQYASYVAAWASAEILMLASNFGLMHAAYRYVRAVSSASDDTGPLQVLGPVWRLLGWRAISLIAGGAVLVLWVSRTGAHWVSGMDTPLFLLLVAGMALFEGLARYVEILFESMLLQWRAQLNTIFRTLAKLAGLALLALTGPLSLQAALLIEVGVGSLGLLLGLLALVQVTGLRPAGAGAADAEPALSWRRVARYVLPAFATQLLGLVYGPDVLKVALASVSGPQALAVFGFAFSLASVLARYLPVNLLGGLLRPAFVLAGSQEPPGNALSGLLQVTIKLNWVMLGAALVMVAPWASQLTGWLSHGNYVQAGPTLWCLMLGLSGVSLHASLSLFCLARENSTAPLLATVAAALIGLPLTLVLGGRWGALGMAVGWGLSELIWVAGCILALKGWFAESIGLAWTGWARLPLATLALVAAGHVGAALLPSAAMPIGGLAMLVFLAYVWRGQVFSAAEQGRFQSILPQRLHFIFHRGGAG